MKRVVLATVLLAAVNAAVLEAESTAQSYARGVGEAALSGAVVDAQGLTLEMGPATLTIDSGQLHAARPVNGVSHEYVLIGDARIRLDPPDAVERGQLEFFIDEPTLDETIQAAVLVIASDAALAAITARPAIVPTVAQRSRAESTLRRWLNSAERKLLAVDGAIVRDLHGDPAYERYFCAWLLSGRRGGFVYLVDPEAHEQVTLGRFEPIPMTPRERRRVERRLHREQRRGRLIGASVDLLGRFDTWLSTQMGVSAQMAGDDGGLRPPSPRGGGPSFDARHYDLELEMFRGSEQARGRADVSLVARVPTSVARLGIHQELTVERVETAAGRVIDHLAAGGELLAFLPRTFEPGEELDLRVTYAGRLIDGKGSSAQLMSTLDWYPNNGIDDPATFEVLFRWPARLDLLASGVRVDGGEADGRRWERRVLERPSGAFGFEVGRFKIESTVVRGIPVTFATDFDGRQLTGKRSREDLFASMQDALEFYLDTFGDYPYEQLTLVTTNRWFSQSLPGFITLSSLMLTDDEWLALYSDLDDPRGLIAHEIAHQWWGHRVAFATYRDVWLSEGMANYAAMLYLRRRVPDLRFGRGPTSGWRGAVTAQLDDGTMIEEVGPLSLGRRLNSSRASAYEPIVYHKGALVLGMLARGVGEDRFLEALRILVEFADQRQLALSSRSFIDLLGRIVHTDLGRFADEFIFSTGLPSIEYEYEIVPNDEGGWRVEGQVARRSVMEFRYEVVENGPERLDVRRRVLAEVGSPEATLYLPFRILLSKTQRGDSELATVKYRSGLLTLAGGAMDFEFDVDQEPLGFELDPNGEVFALARDRSLYPKRQQVTRSLEALAREDRATARASLVAVLTSPAYAGDEPLSDAWIEGERDSYDARAHRELCRLDLAAGDTEAAATHLAKAAETMSYRQRKGLNYRVLEARIALQRGDAAGAVEILEKDVYRDENRHLEANLVFAIAAAKAGRQRDAMMVLARLDDRPAEFGVLTAKMTG